MLIFMFTVPFAWGGVGGVGWVGLITCNRLRSLILRLALPIVISNTLLLLCYEQKNILTRSWCYLLALSIVMSNTLLLLHTQVALRSCTFALSIVIFYSNFQHILASTLWTEEHFNTLVTLRSCTFALSIVVSNHALAFTLWKEEHFSTLVTLRSCTFYINVQHALASTMNMRTY